MQSRSALALAQREIDRLHELLAAEIEARRRADTIILELSRQVIARPAGDDAPVAANQAAGRTESTPPASEGHIIGLGAAAALDCGRSGEPEGTVEITALQLATARLDRQRAFYAETLGLPLVAADAASFTVRAGASRLTFTAGAPGVPYHFAFDIPRAMLPQAKAFLAARLPLLAKDGQDQFHSDDWNADRVYVADAAGNLVEFIARQTRPDDAAGDFTAALVRHVSEVGLPVDDVPATVAALAARLGVAPYGAQSAAFAPIGDDRGLLIIVRMGRPWSPTGTPANVAPLKATLRGARADAFVVPGFPYLIAVTTK